ncbi:hypothetical protein ACVXG8_14485 [Escherichia coli]
MAKGEITTHGTESYAAYANGTVVKAGDTLDYTNASVTLTDVDITTHGDNAHAIAARQGQFHLTRRFIQRVLTPRLLKFIMAAR